MTEWLGGERERLGERESCIGDLINGILFFCGEFVIAKAEFGNLWQIPI